MRTVWITGAQGFIGRHLARHLFNSGHQVYGIGHGVWSEYDYSAWGLSGWLNGEIDATNLNNIAGQSGLPDQVYHLAGGSAVGPSIKAPLEDFSRTVFSCARLLDWLRSSAPKACLVTVSSAAVYGSGHDAAIAESDAIHPFSPYGHHKMMMEQLCHSYAETYGLRSVVVRLFSVYGSWLRKQLLWDLCSRLASGETVLCLGGSGKELRDWTDVSDVVRLLAFAASIKGDGVSIMNGGSGVATSVQDVAQMVVNAWDVAGISVAFNGLSRAGDPFSLVADSRRLDGLNFEWKVPVEDGIRAYVEWCKEVVV
jgi:UDP-glucose 4-epimerase